MTMIEILELFAGKGAKLRRPMIEAMGHKYTTSDIDPRFGCDITADIFDIKSLPRYDFIWASTPCEKFSVASIGTYWTKDKDGYHPKTESARIALSLVDHTLALIWASGTPKFVIENPRGMLRKMDVMRPLKYGLRTVTYCQYGERRMKPTDLWIYGFDWTPRPMCKRGDPCHERAPRGAKTGTQGIKGAVDRAVVPWQLWEEILASVCQAQSAL